MEELQEAQLLAQNERSARQSSGVLVCGELGGAEAYEAWILRSPGQSQKLLKRPTDSQAVVSQWDSQFHGQLLNLKQIWQSVTDWRLFSAFAEATEIYPMGLCELYQFSLPIDTFSLSLQFSKDL